MADQADNRTADALASAHALLERGAWTEALELAGSGDLLEADGLDIVAEGSWWLGRLDDCIAAREQAYAGYEALGERRRSGQCAVWLWEHHMIKARPAIAGGWLRRARRALDDEADCVELGALVLREAEVTHGSGELAAAEAMARDALAMGERLSSVNLQAEALQTIGRILIDAGRVADGLGHLDEAMLSAVEGRLSPYATGKVYCSLISACEELGDLRRAAEWTDATSRWSESHPPAMWPGICRVHHAALLHLRGDVQGAEREARQACEELDGFHVGNVAAGYIEIGEIRRRLGDLEGAEAAFLRAEDLCGRQSAGLALVRLAQRRVDDATAIITGLLAGQTWSQLARGKLLPARVQIAVAADDLDTAEEAVTELENIAAAYDNPALLAAASSSRGRLLLARGELDAACATLREATRRWQELDVPYEVATARLMFGQACRSCGDEDGATRSLASAAAIFDQLGASIEAGQLEPGPAAAGLPSGLTAREAEVLALVASGRTNKDIAADLVLSERTVARHLSNIFTKIGVGSRTAAAAFAFEHGLAQASPPG